MTKHEGFTPGPWTCDAPGHRPDEVEHSSSVGITADDWDCLATVYTAGSDPNDKEGLANARLIADAPRLYAENQRLREALEWDRVLFARFGKGEGTRQNALHAWTRAGDVLTGEETP